MNPMLQEALASIVRHVFTIAAGWFAARGIWSEADATQYAAAGALAVVGIGWGLYQKYVSRQKLVVAMATPSPVSEAHVERQIAAGNSVPSTTTPKEQTPRA